MRIKNCTHVSLRGFVRVGVGERFCSSLAPSSLRPKFPQDCSCGCRDADRKGVQGLMLADDEVKPTLSDDQTNALTKAFKEADGFTYTIECGVFPELVSWELRTTRTRRAKGND